MNNSEVLEQKEVSIPELMSTMAIYQLATVEGSINYGRQLQLQFKRLTKKRFSVTIAEGVHPSKGYNIRRIA